jgi:O-antigen ligase
MLLSFALGTLKYKTAAGVAMRPFFYTMAVALYFSTVAFDPRMQRIFVRTSGVLAALLVGVAALRWGGLLDGAGDSSTGRFATLERIRAINSVQSLLVLQFALLALVGQRLTFPSAFGRITGNALLLFTLVLQHRSVWVAGMAAVFATALSGARRHFGAIAFGGVVVALLIVVLSALGIGGSLFGEVSRSAARAVQGADTAQARLDTWQFALGKWWGGGPSAWLFGLPFGTNMERVVVNSQGDAQKISFQSHSFYIQTLFSLGLVGLGSWLAFFAATGRRLLQQARSGTAGVWPSLLFSLFVSQLAYYLTYGTSYEHGLLLGVCAAVAFARPLAQAGQVAAAPGRMAPSPSGAPP